MAGQRFVNLLAVVLMVAAVLCPASACPFAGMWRGRALKEKGGDNSMVVSHEEFRSLVQGPRRSVQQATPGEYRLDPPVPDALGNRLSIPSVSIGSYPYELVDRFAATANETKRDMCYSATQILPVPPLGFNVTAYHAGDDPCPPGTCSFNPSAIDQTDSLAVVALATLAVNRWNKMIDDKGMKSPIVFGSVSVGGLLRRKLCSIGYGMAEGLCKDKIFHDPYLQWLTAFTIIRVTPKNAEDVKATIQRWRTTKTGHLPNMYSEIVNNGYGYGGVDQAFNGKLVPCDLVPKQLWYQKSGYEMVNPKTGRLVVSEAVEWWSLACQAFVYPGLFEDWGPQTCPPPPPGKRPVPK